MLKVDGARKSWVFIGLGREKRTALAELIELFKGVDGKALA